MEAKELKDNSIPLPIDMLNPACRIHCEENYAKIKSSIEWEGLKYPLVVLNTTYQKWQDFHEESPESIRPCPSTFLTARCFMVMIGNNRLKIAQELEWEEIDCIVVEDRQEVNKWAKIMREDWDV